MSIANFDLWQSSVTLDIFPVVPNTCLKSIQKQIVQYDIKSKYREEYTTVDKVGSEKRLVRNSCFV